MLLILTCLAIYLLRESFFCLSAVSLSRLRHDIPQFNLADIGQSASIQFGSEFHLRSLPCRQSVDEPVVLFLLLHRADENQLGQNSRTRLQFLAFSLDSIMSEPRQAFYIVTGLVVIALWELVCLKVGCPSDWVTRLCYPTNVSWESQLFIRCFRKTLWNVYLLNRVTRLPGAVQNSSRRPITQPGLPD